MCNLGVCKLGGPDSCLQPLASRVQVAEDLVPKMLAVSGNGQKVEFLTNDRVLTKFFNRFVKACGLHALVHATSTRRIS